MALGRDTVLGLQDAPWEQKGAESGFWDMGLFGCRIFGKSLPLPLFHFFYMDNKIPIPFKMNLGQIYTKSHIRFHPLHLRMSQALCSQVCFRS